MLEKLEVIRLACAERLFSGEKAKSATWDEIGAGLRAVERQGEYPWSSEREFLANFGYGDPPMPLGAEELIAAMTGFKL